MECVLCFCCMGIYCYSNNGSSYGSSIIVVGNYLFVFCDFGVDIDFFFV